MLRQATKNEIAMFLFDLSFVGVSKEKEFARGGNYRGKAHRAQVHNKRNSDGNFPWEKSLPLFLSNEKRILKGIHYSLFSLA